MQPRVVTVEVLDTLAADDPCAVRSRQDLRRLHIAMGTSRILRHALKRMPGVARQSAPVRVLELGAGDGTLMLDVARTLVPPWTGVELTLLDRHKLVSHTTRAAYTQIGWTAAPLAMDVFDWVQQASMPTKGAAPQWDLIIANLFIHHFSNAQLIEVLATVSQRTRHFLACEPRRSWLALVGSRVVSAIGANAVTREDAVLSVRAGFRDHELTALWPQNGTDWQTQEYCAGLFSHCFVARHIGAGQ